MPDGARNTKRKIEAGYPQPQVIGTRVEFVGDSDDDEEHERVFNLNKDEMITTIRKSGADGIRHCEEDRIKIQERILKTRQCELCDKEIDRFEENLIRLTYNGTREHVMRLCCCACTAHVLLGMDWKYSHPHRKWSITQFHAQHDNTYTIESPPAEDNGNDHDDVNERMCEECGLWLVSTYIKLTYKPGVKASTEITEDKQLCYYCAARAFLDIHTGKAYLTLSRFPAMHEVVT